MEQNNSNIKEMDKLVSDFFKEADLFIKKLKEKKKLCPKK